MHVKFLFYKKIRKPEHFTIVSKPKECKIKIYCNIYHTLKNNNTQYRINS